MRAIFLFFVLFCGFFLPTGAFIASAKQVKVLENCGMASWYGEKHAGKKTANGEIFNPSDFTAAHRTAEFGTLVTVWNKRNNRIVIVRVNDRGPFSGARIIDISKSAAEELGLITSGVGNVCISY